MKNIIVITGASSGFGALRHALSPFDGKRSFALKV
jgi:hypothetical protein